MDKYIVKVCRNGKGPYYFYKNGKLHRESGTAILAMKKKDLVKLEDKDLYKVEVIKEDTPLDYQTDYIQIPYENINNSLFKLVVSRIVPAHYYLNGQPYSQKDFEKVKDKIDLENELFEDLESNQKNNKKIKI